MVVLLILMSISATLISCVVQTRNQFIREEQSLQTALIVEAGLARGVAQLRMDRSYSGERWQIPTEDLTGVGSARVAIVVTDTADVPGERTISASAEYPLGTPNPIRITRELRIPGKEPSP
jgi:hypothetical protein